MKCKRFLLTYSELLICFLSYLSLTLNILAVLVPAMRREAYSVTFVFMLLLMKIVFLFKSTKAEF